MGSWAKSHPHVRGTICNHPAGTRNTRDQQNSLRRKVSGGGIGQAMGEKRTKPTQSEEEQNKEQTSYGPSQIQRKPVDTFYYSPGTVLYGIYLFQGSFRCRRCSFLSWSLSGKLSLFYCALVADGHTVSRV